MTLWDQLHDQLTTMDTLAEHHLWVTTEEIMALLRLDPRPLVDAQGNVTPEFGWRNFRMSQVKYAGNGQHLWRVVNHEKPAAPAPAETVEPVSGTPASAIVHYGFLTAAQRFDLGSTSGPTIGGSWQRHGMIVPAPTAKIRSCRVSGTWRTS